MSTIKDIEVIVNNFFNLDLRNKSREVKFIQARSMYYKLCFEYAPRVTYTSLGIDMGITHASVHNLIKKFNFNVNHDKELMKKYLALCSIIENKSNVYGDLELKVISWALDKGILDKATPTTQSLKTLEECHELIDAIDKENKYEIIDALGDIMVTIIIQAKMQGVNLLECLDSAYKVISKRTGKMIDGTFVKDK